LWSCSIARMWRTTAVLISLIVGLFLLIALPLNTILSVINRTDVPHEPLIYAAMIAGGLLGSSVAMLFGWRILVDSWKVATTSDDECDLYTMGQRGLRVVAAAFGIHPICGWLPGAWRRLVAAGLFILSAAVLGVTIIWAIYVSVTEVPRLLITPLLLSVSHGEPMRSMVVAQSWMPIILFISVAAGVAIATTFRYFARRFARVSVENLSRLDKRTPILFLRSFHDDQVKLDRPKQNLFTRLVTMGAPPPTLDAVLLEECTPLGPVVAIGVPGSPPPFGAARTYADDQEWQNVVANLAQDSRLIVIVVDDTPGVDWELRHIEGSGLSAKTLYLLPPRLAPPAEAGRILGRELLHSSNLNGSDGASNLSDWLAAPCIGWHQTPDGKVVIFTSARPTRDSYVCALRLVRRQEFGRAS
jgi:hypothetical protein